MEKGIESMKVEMVETLEMITTEKSLEQTIGTIMIGNRETWTDLLIDTLRKIEITTLISILESTNLLEGECNLPRE